MFIPNLLKPVSSCCHNSLGDMWLTSESLWFRRVSYEPHDVQFLDDRQSV